MFYPELARRHQTRLLYLGDRAAYTHHVAPLRIARLRERIFHYKPRAVVFYGTAYEHWWRRIAGVDFTRAGSDKVWVASKAGTLFVLMLHPTAHGLPNTYFDGIGRSLARASLP
jgi:hypothetical protein